MSIIVDITINEITQIGITKIGHKMRILKEITKLKPHHQQQHIVGYEGGSTAYI